MAGAPAHRVTRFMSLVDQSSISRDGCWLWIGAGKGNGYGSFVIDGKSWPAHRAAYLIFNGAHPGEKDVCHKCDNRACVNPDHLFLGTRRENMADCAKKGRIARGAKLGDRRGDKGPAAKISWEDVRQIRASSEPSKQLAKRFNITNDNINRIRRYDTWKEQ